MDNYATNKLDDATVSGPKLTDYEKVDKLFALHNRRTTVVSTKEFTRITDLGRYGKNFSQRNVWPTEFTFNPDGSLHSVSRWFKGRWLLRGSGVSV